MGMRTETDTIAGTYTTDNMKLRNYIKEMARRQKQEKIKTKAETQDKHRRK